MFGCGDSKRLLAPNRTRHSSHLGVQRFPKHKGGQLNSSRKISMENAHRNFPGQSAYRVAAASIPCDKATRFSRCKYLLASTQLLLSGVAPSKKRGSPEATQTLQLRFCRTRTAAHGKPNEAPFVGTRMLLNGWQNTATTKSHAGLPKASESSVFCSNSWALAEPVAGVEFAARLMLRSLEPRIRFRRGVTNESAPILAGSSCTQMN